jgi:hypothetical protein
LESPFSVRVDMVWSGCVPMTVLGVPISWWTSEPVGTVGGGRLLVLPVISQSVFLNLENLGYWQPLILPSVFSWWPYFVRVCSWLGSRFDSVNPVSQVVGMWTDVSGLFHCAVHVARCFCPYQCVLKSDGWLSLMCSVTTDLSGQSLWVITHCSIKSVPLVCTSFRGEVSHWSHVVDLWHVKGPYRAWVRCFVGQTSRSLFLTRDSPASLPDGSGCWIRMIKMHVLGLKASHLLLICTNLGYGTVLTVACACQGCSASDLVWFGFWNNNADLVSEEVFNNLDAVI